MDGLASLRAAREDPAGFIEGEGLLVIDEFQKAGEGLLLAIKEEVDRRPSPGRFLLTGSTRFLIVPRLSESLAGRVDILDLWPLSQGEIRGVREAFTDLLFGSVAALRSLRPPALARKEYFSALCRGGFPEALRRSEAGRRTWFASYVDTVTRKDVPEIARIRQSGELKRILRLLAANTAGELNVASLARDLAMPRSTVDGYLPLLETVYLVFQVPAWSRNLSAKVTKHPKVHVLDAGLAAHLLAVDPDGLSRTTSPAAGRLLDTFVAGELARQRSWAQVPFDLHHLRDRDGMEVDLVLAAADGTVAGVEVKSARSLGASDARSLTWMRDRLGSDFAQGVILYTGEAVLPLGDRITALPLSALWSGGREPH
jgi:predicted AAA+ superfamily ATPase